jgi:Flp pilus assembly protein TadG
MRHTSPLGSVGSGLRRERRGSTTLEFAVVAFPFIIFLVFLLELGYDFFAQVALNYGVQTAARQIQIGAAQGANTAAIFQTNYLCPALSGLLPCTSVTVNVMPIVSDYYTNVAATLPTNAAGNLNTSAFTYCPGGPNQLMLVQAIYTSPSLVSAFIPSMATATAGGLVRVTLSSTAFINENFPVTAPAPAGC